MSKQSAKASLASEIDAFTGALEISKDRFLTRNENSDPKDLTKFPLPRETYYGFARGDTGLSDVLVDRISARLQFYLKAAFRDREALEDLKIAREKARPWNAKALFKLLLAVMMEETESEKVLDDRGKRANKFRGELSTVDPAKILDAIDQLIELREKKGDVRDLNRALQVLSTRPRAIVVRQKEKFFVATSGQIFAAFRSKDASDLSAQVNSENPSVAPDAQVVTTPVVWSVDSVLYGEEWIQRFLDDAQTAGYKITILGIERLKDGCTTVYLKTSAKDAQALLDAFRAGKLESAGVTSVLDPIAEEADTGPIPEGSHDAQLRQSLRRALFRESLIRPWRRLRCLFNGRIADSPLARTLSESDRRAYASPHVENRWRLLQSDLLTTIVLWPFFGAAIAGLLLLLIPDRAIQLGLLTGFALALFGAQPCSTIISPLACGAGTVIMGVAFSVVHGVALATMDASLFSAENIRRDPFMSVVGGLIGISAPAWRARLPLPLIVVLIACVALSIAYAGWLMAQPRRARRRKRYFPPENFPVGLIFGTCAGGGIGLILGLTGTFGPFTGQPQGFILAFVIIGGLCMFLSTSLRTGSSLRGIVVAILHSAAGAALFSFAFSKAGTTVGLAALAASTGFFHSTFFTTAFAVGEWRGGTRAAFAAAALEGAVGFSAFVISRMF